MRNQAFVLSHWVVQKRGHFCPRMCAAGTREQKCPRSCTKNFPLSQRDVKSRILQNIMTEQNTPATRSRPLTRRAFMQATGRVTALSAAATAFPFVSRGRCPWRQ